MVSGVCARALRIATLKWQEDAAGAKALVREIDNTRAHHRTKEERISAVNVPSRRESPTAGADREVCRWRLEVSWLHRWSGCVVKIEKNPDRR